MNHTVALGGFLTFSNLNWLEPHFETSRGRQLPTQSLVLLNFSCTALPCLLVRVESLQIKERGFDLLYMKSDIR